jgi:2-dehydropantoate 2-reductase
MKIAVVGCGAVGSFYGAKLARAGEEVHFLLRSDYEVVRKKGVSIHSRDGNFHVRPKAAKTPGEIGPADLVLIALKTIANDQFPSLIPPLVASQTAVLTLQNGLGNEEALAQIIAPEQILGGLCFVCLNRTAPGVIDHTDHGAVVIGEFGRWPEPRTHDIATMFRNAGIPCQVSDNLAQAHWEKLAWNIPFNGLGVASAAGKEGMADPDSASLRGPCLTTDKLLADAEWELIVRELIREVIAGGRALGFKMKDDLEEVQIARTRTMGAYKPSTLIDFENGKPLELISLFFEPLRLARSAGISVPRLTALCEVLKRLDVPKIPQTGVAGPNPCP